MTQLIFNPVWGKMVSPNLGMGGTRQRSDRFARETERDRAGETPKYPVNTEKYGE